MTLCPCSADEQLVQWLSSGSPCAPRGPGTDLRCVVARALAAVQHRPQAGTALSPGDWTQRTATTGSPMINQAAELTGSSSEGTAADDDGIPIRRLGKVPGAILKYC